MRVLHCGCNSFDTSFQHCTCVHCWIRCTVLARNVLDRAEALQYVRGSQRDCWRMIRTAALLLCLPLLFSSAATWDWEEQGSHQ